MQTSQCILDLLFLMSLIWCAASDWRSRTIPNRAILGIAVLGMAQLGFALGIRASIWPQLAAIPFFGVLYLWWTKELLGGGDVKLMALICLYMGIGRAAIAFEICLAALCAIYFATAKGSKRLKRRKVALAPPLALGCVCVIVCQYVAAWL